MKIIVYGLYAQITPTNEILNRAKFYLRGHQARMSLARQNYSEEAEAALNAQINQELTAFYTYLSMASWCNRDTVALPGLHAYFANQSLEEHQHALRLLAYQATRGGAASFPAIAAASADWKSPVACLEAALELEMSVNASLLKLHQIAEKHGDPQLEDFIEQGFLEEQVQSIKEISDLITQAKRVGSDGLGMYLFDLEVGKKVKKP